MKRECLKTGLDGQASNLLMLLSGSFSATFSHQRRQIGTRTNKYAMSVCISTQHCTVLKPHEKQLKVIYYTHTVCNKQQLQSEPLVFRLSLNVLYKSKNVL